MAKLTTQEVLDELTKLYQAKQDLSAIDDSLNTQAAAITAKAAADIAALKTAQQTARDAATVAMQASETVLHKGK